MLHWLTDNWGNITVIALVALAVVFAARSLIRDKRSGKCACGVSCGSCGGCSCEPTAVDADGAVPPPGGCPSCSSCAMAERCPSRK